MGRKLGNPSVQQPFPQIVNHPLLNYLAGCNRPYATAPVLLGGSEGVGKSRLAIWILNDYIKYGEVFADALKGLGLPAVVPHPVLAVSEMAALSYIPPRPPFRVYVVRDWADLLAVLAHEPSAFVAVDSVTMLANRTVTAANLAAVGRVSEIAEAEDAWKTRTVVWSEEPEKKGVRFVEPNSPTAASAVVQSISLPLLNQRPATVLITQMRMSVGAFAYQKTAGGLGLRHAANPIVILSKTDKPNVVVVSTQKATGAPVASMRLELSPSGIWEALGEQLGVTPDPAVITQAMIERWVHASNGDNR